MIVTIAGVPYETTRTLYAVSRSYYTELKAPALSLLNALFATRERIMGVILITPEFIRCCVTALTCYCRSPIEGITEFFDRVVGHHVSKGSIGRILQDSSEKAEAFERSVALNTVRDIAADEIFQQGKPVLTAVDLKMHYVVMMEVTKDRAGETWKAAPEEQKTRGLSPETCVSDGGTDLLKGVPDVFPDIETQADAFHALRDIGRHIQSAECKSSSLFRRLEHLEEKLRKPKAKEEERKQYAELWRVPKSRDDSEHHKLKRFHSEVTVRRIFRMNPVFTAANCSK